MRVTKLCVCVWKIVCDQVVCVTKFQSRRTQSESEHAVWWQLASHLAQPEHIAHCFVLASSRTPGQWGDRRHHVGLLLGTGTHAQWRTTKRCKVKATTAATKIGEHHAALSLRTSGAQLRNRQRQTSEQQLFQSQRTQSESEHPLWWQLASHLTQPEHMAHCSLLSPRPTRWQTTSRRSAWYRSTQQNMIWTWFDTGTCDLQQVVWFDSLPLDVASACCRLQLVQSRSTQSETELAVWWQPASYSRITWHIA